MFFVCVSSGVRVGGRDRETGGTHSLRSQTVDHLSRLAAPSFVSLLYTSLGSRALHWESVGVCLLYISADRAQTD